MRKGTHKSSGFDAIAGACSHGESGWISEWVCGLVTIEFGLGKPLRDIGNRDSTKAIAHSNYLLMLHTNMNWEVSHRQKELSAEGRESSAGSARATLGSDASSSTVSGKFPRMNKI